MQLYADAGYEITHLGFLNEPDYEVSYSQMQISDDAAEAIDFIPILNETIQAAGLNTKVRAILLLPSLTVPRYTISILLTDWVLWWLIGYLL